MFIMNAKFKISGPVPPNVGRPVGVIPFSTQPVMSSSRKKSSSYERRHMKGTSPSDSSTAKQSQRSQRSKNLPEQKPPDQSDDEGQDIKFIDCDTASTTISSCSRSAQGSRKGSASRIKRTLSTKDILDRSQESDPYKVFEVELHGAELTHIPDLEKFRKLRLLDVSGNYIKKIKGLEMNKDLRDIKLYDNSISTIEGLESLKDLCNLQLQHNDIKNIGRGLSCLKKLQFLRLDSNKLSQIETPELLSCSAITILDLSNNELKSLSPLSYLPNLEELSASGNQISKIGDLSKCRKLQEVNLSCNKLFDLTGIANLPNIQILDVSQNELKCLKSLGKMKSLEELNVDTNHVSSFISFPSIFPKLQILRVCDNSVSHWEDVCSLSGLPELVELFISGNPFCLEDGEMPTYHLHIAQELLRLEIIDGAHLKRPTGQRGTTPMMRPMSASSIISVKQVDSQLQSVTRETESLLNNISERFTSLRTMFDKLPSQAPPPSAGRSFSDSPTQGQTSRTNSRLRIREAQEFAAANFDDYDL